MLDRTHPWRNVSLGLTAALAVSAPAMGQSVGVVIDAADGRAIVFDADAASSMAALTVPNMLVGDCVIEPQSGLAFVSTYASEVYIIDLTTDPPQFADGVNPIHITNPGSDLALTADGRFLLATNGGSTVPVSVVDIEQRAEVDARSIGSDNTSVEVGLDGSVLIGTRTSVRKFMLDDAGRLYDSRQSLVFQRSNNVVIAPGGFTGVAIGRSDERLTSFRIDAMSAVQTHDMNATGISGVFHPAGDRLYVRTNDPGGINAYAFDPATGAFVETPIFTIDISRTRRLFGLDQLAIHPSGDMLYVAEGSGVSIYDSDNGAHVGSIANLAVVDPVAIAIASLETAPANESPTVIFDEPAMLWPPNRALVDVGDVLSVHDADGDALAMTLRIFSNEPEDANRHAPDFKDEYFDGGRGMLVRRERSGRGDGRFYLLVISVDDGRGGVTDAVGVLATVPHDRGARRQASHLMDAAFEARAQLEAMLSESGLLPESLGLYEHGVAEASGPKQ